MLKNTSFAEKSLFSVLIIFLSVIFTSVTGFIMGITINSYTLPLSLLVISAVSFFVDKKLFKAILLNIIILFTFIFINKFIFDWSYYGMYYHKQAVITLKEGWNPFYAFAIEHDPFAGYPDMSLWLENYPKGLWIFSAAIYAMTNLLETGKAVNILFVMAVFYASYDVIQFYCSKKTSILLALLFAINPVFISQIFTHYNDLTVGSLFIISILLCIKLYINKTTAYTYLSLLFLTAFSPLIKFTAPCLLALTYVFFGILCLIKHRSDLKWMIKPSSIIISGFLIGFIFFGFDPYIEHIKDGYHVLHPVMGEEKYDIMNTNPPKGFDENNALENVFISLFSKTSNDIKNEPKLKIPFSVHSSEFEPLSNADTRIAGFGVFFSGIFILSLLFFIALLIKKKKIPLELSAALIYLFALMLFFPESWWARYASFIYYLPIFMLILSFMHCNKKVLPIICSLIVIANSVITGFCVVNTGIKITIDINDRLEEIKKPGKKIVLRVNDFPTHVKLFSEYGIDFEISHQPISPGESIFYRNTKYKIIPE